LRRRLRSAERFNDAAMRFGSRLVKTPRSRSSTSLSRVTRADQRRPRDPLRVDLRRAVFRSDRRDELAADFRANVRVNFRTMASIRS
jgi:hypothetical protein